MSVPLGPVLVATDLQASSRSIVEFAGRLARAANTRLFLLHVVETPGQAWLARPTSDARLEQLRTDCARALRLQEESLVAAGVRVTSDLVVGRPAHEAILDRVVDTGASILVVGSGAREGRGHRLGSTADRVLRRSPVPCLIVRGRFGFPIEKAAAATDFSSHARRAIRVALPWLDHLAGEEAGFDLLHVAYRSYLDLDPSLDGFLRGKLDKEAARLARDTDAHAVGVRLCVGNHLVDALVEAASEAEYGLLIAATHGLGPVRRTIIGSVAMGLAQSAPCPVLIVPPKARR